MQDQADTALLAELVEGRAEAFAALFDRYGRTLHRVAWTLLRSRQDAEDAVQEVFLGLYRSRDARSSNPQCRPASSPSLPIRSQ